MTELTLIFALLFAILAGVFLGLALAIISAKSAGLKLVPTLDEKVTDDDGYLICEDAERIEIDEETFNRIMEEIKERYGNDEIED